MTIVGSVVVLLQYHHGNLTVSVGDNAPLNEDRPTYFFFKVPKGTEYSRYVLPVQLKLTNTSNLFDDEVRMVISYDRKYLRAEIPEEAMKHDMSRPTGEQRYEISTDDTNDYVKYSTTFLSPKTSRSFSDGAFATQIPRDFQDPLLFNSGVGLDINVSTYSKSDIERGWNIRYRGLQVQNDAEISEVIIKWYTQQLAYEIRKESGFWGYIPKLIFQKSVMMYGYSPDFKFIPGMNVFVPASKPKQISIYQVWPYSIQLLFHFSKGESLLPWS
ncbi:hypothetical protein [Azospira oryzae]|nr:hypothetical protein [Azospira oryzae]